VLLAVPSGHIVSLNVFRLANLFLPVPREMLEQFSSQVLPEDIPLWQLVVLIAILPGICEELAFRGTLLYGLRRRFGPVGLVLVVGLIFGIFHFALFRIVPTAFLGVILTAMAVMTGSIFPSILAHAGNNALAIWLSRQSFSPDELKWWVHVIAFAVFAFSLYLMYRAGRGQRYAARAAAAPPAKEEEATFSNP
jgi:membrane protease YdiL (CAAX protease family)